MFRAERFERQHGDVSISFFCRHPLARSHELRAKQAVDFLASDLQKSALGRVDLYQIMLPDCTRNQAAFSFVRPAF